MRGGNLGINIVDSAYKGHDIAYSKYSYSANRVKADRQLAERTWKRGNQETLCFVEKQ